MSLPYVSDDFDVQRFIEKDLIFIFHLNHYTKIAKLLAIIPLFDDGVDGDEFEFEKHQKISLDEFTVPADFYIDISEHYSTALLQKIIIF